MGVVLLKKDIQKAIANNVKHFKSDYRSLIFDNENREYIKSLYFIENLNVTVDDNRLLYDIKLNEEALERLSSADIARIQKIDLRSRLQDMVLKKMAEYNLIKFKGFRKKQEEEKTAVKMAKLKEGKILKIKTIQQILKETFNIETKLKESQPFLSLEANLKELHLSRNMLEELECFFDELDIFAIVPCFDDEHDTINGVRIFLAINKE